MHDFINHHNQSPILHQFNPFYHGANDPTISLTWNIQSAWIFRVFVVCMYAGYLPFMMQPQVLVVGLTTGGLWLKNCTSLFYAGSTVLKLGMWVFSCKSSYAEHFTSCEKAAKGFNFNPTGCIRFLPTHFRQLAVDCNATQWRIKYTIYFLHCAVC
jgi:hypothetical protein